MRAADSVDQGRIHIRHHFHGMVSDVGMYTEGIFCQHTLADFAAMAASERMSLAPRGTAASCTGSSSA